MSPKAPPVEVMGQPLDPILIAGGGIGGLACAIALAGRGLASHVLERRQSFCEDGAGIQISPNGMGVLRRLGVAASLEPTAGKPHSIDVYDGATARRLAGLPLGAWINERFGAPYWVAHRRDLQAALLSAAGTSPLIQISNGFSVAALMERDGRVGVTSADGRAEQGPLLIGADGLWSKTRELLFPRAALSFSGRTAARAVISASATAAPFSSNATGVWLAPHAHVVHYPLRGGTELAVIVVIDEDWQGEGWGAAADNTALLASLAGLAPELLRFLGAIPAWRKWALYDPPALPSWSRGRTLLLGDAAHPVMPFLAQGGALALEDAETLAARLASCGTDYSRAFTAFERERYPRATRVANASRRSGEIFHLSAPLAWARNLVLRTAPPRLIMRRYDWLYGWPGPETD